MEAYNSFLAKAKIQQNKLEMNERHKRIKAKKALDEYHEKQRTGKVRKFKAKTVTYRWKIDCPGCTWQFLDSFKKVKDSYICDCGYEITKDRIFDFGNDDLKKKPPKKTTFYPDSGKYKIKKAFN